MPAADSARSARFEHKGDDEENRKPLTGVLAKLNMLKSKLAPAPEAKPKCVSTCVDARYCVRGGAGDRFLCGPPVIVLQWPNRIVCKGAYVHCPELRQHRIVSRN